ncbi:MAG: DNA repair protein RecN [Candidatus Krumholzibacteriia bacterium]
MLRRLRIQNLAVVEEANLEFVDGLNVLTGSTGAGKSLILGAVNILLGERSGARAIRAGEDEAIVEGEFVLGEPVPAALLAGGHSGARVTLRRQIHRSGRSFAFINERPQPLKKLQEIARQLIEPHGQNEQLQLRHEESHVVYVDKLAGNGQRLAAYGEALAAYRRASGRLDDFDRKLAIVKEKKELLEHRLQEVGRARLRPGEKEELEGSVRLMENAQEIYRALGEACELIYDDEESAVTAVARARKGIERIADLDSRFSGVVSALDGAEITLKETASELRTLVDSLEFDPARLEEMQERLAYITGLERRYQAPVSGLIEESERWKAELEALAFEDEERSKLEDECRKRLATTREAALALGRARREAAAKLDRTMSAQLGRLMMRGAAFRTGVTLHREDGGELVMDGEPVRLHADGIDHVVFYVRTNPGEAEGGVGEIASSGELSRIALALKTAVSMGREGSVLVFDELDAGVGADLGGVIAGKLDTLSRAYQIICITHMPQIAARAGRHLVVSKRTSAGRTSAGVTAVDGEVRLKEIARMLGGGDGSQKRLALAREMLHAQPDKPSKRVRP